MLGEPLAYILGYKDFYSMRLRVDVRVLIPRADTEVLVDWALHVLRATDLASHPHVLDLGTGSGAIALAIASVMRAEISVDRAVDLVQTPQSEKRVATISAIDASNDALVVATKNAQALGLALESLQNNWFSKVKGRFNAIPSDPPYIPQSDPHLAALSHEPVKALTGGSDGLENTRKIIVSHKESSGLTFAVDVRLSVPGPDTETLVQRALDSVSSTGEPEIIDLGTGSGAGGISVAHSLKAHVTATDFSDAALAVASQNAEQLDVDVQFIQSNWFDNVSGHYHVIVSNPPYIASDDTHLSALAHEPLNALIAGPDGLDDIRRIVQQAPKYLQPGGWLLLEHGYDQASAVFELLTQRGFNQVQSRRDLTGITRCSGGQWDNQEPIFKGYDHG